LDDKLAVYLYGSRIDDGSPGGIKFHYQLKTNKLNFVKRC